MDVNGEKVFISSSLKLFIEIISDNDDPNNVNLPTETPNYPRDYLHLKLKHHYLIHDQCDSI